MASQNTEPVTAPASRREILKLGTAMAGVIALGATADAPSADATSTEARAPASFALPAAEPDVALAPLAVIALDRLAWGPKPGDPTTSIEAFNALGADDDARLAAWVTQQLDPTFLGQQDDSDTRIANAAAVLPSLNLNLPQLWATYYTATNADRTRPARDVRVATLIRAVTSRRQLYEVMVDFWHNHFSIFAWGYDYASATWASYDRDVIRANALGNFRTLVEKVAKSTAMLYYLDNYISQGASFNENWGRELLELHTLGAENYLGTQDPTGVPIDPVSGLHVGYVDNDVYEAARCFTGWRVNNGQSSAPGNDGTFLYHNPWHDRANKFFLGKYMPADQAPEADGKQVLDWLAQHPGTARFIVRKLWRRLIGDNTPLIGEVNATFDAAVAKWLELWNPTTPGSDGQIREVVRILVTSPEFKTTWGQKIKRPHEALYGALRAVGAEIKPDSGGLSSLWSTYDAMDQQLFGRRPPDGFPDVRDAWTNTASMLYRWRLFNGLLENSFYSTSTNTGVQVDNAALIATTGPNNTPQSIVDFWVARILGRAMDDPAHLAELVKLMQGNTSPVLPGTVYASPTSTMSATDISNRLRRMIAAILMSPEFQWR